MSKVGLADRCQAGTETSAVSADAISSWHQLSLFPSASAQLALAHAGDHSDFLVNSCKILEPWARTPESTATQGNAHGIYIYKYLPSFHCLHEQRPSVENPELWAAFMRESHRAWEGVMELLETSNLFLWAFLVRVSRAWEIIASCIWK